MTLDTATTPEPGTHVPPLSPRERGPGGEVPARVGEVIDATTTELTAQSYELHQSPFFGSFVRASNGDADVWAVVAQAHTGGIDPGRHPVARGAAYTSEAEVYAQNPELPQLLRTVFTALVVGYSPPGPDVRHRLPPRPARVHAFVYAATPSEVAAFTERLDYIDAILRLQTAAPVDELVAAAIRSAAAARRGPHPGPLPLGEGRGEGDHPEAAYRLRCGRHLARLLGREPARLVAMLQRLRE